MKLMHVTFFISFLFCLIGCKGSGHPATIQFIIPRGYRGTFVIRPNKSAMRSKVGGIPTFHIPNSGILEISDSDVLENWYSATAEYDDGKVVPIGTTSPVEPYDKFKIELHLLGEDSTGAIYFYIGTENDFALVQKRGDYTLGSVTKMDK